MESEVGWHNKLEHNEEKKVRCNLIKYERKGRQSIQAKHSELIFPNTYKQEF